MLIRTIIGSILGHLNTLLLLAALLIAGCKSRGASREARCLVFYRWISLLAVGVNGVYAFIMHAFFGNFTAQVIGWLNSPFQYEVAIANLCVGVLGMVAFREKTTQGFRAASVLITTIWLWGDAIGHLKQMIVMHDFAPGNAGAWFWLDVLTPILLIVFFRRGYKKSQ